MPTIDKYALKLDKIRLETPKDSVRISFSYWDSKANDKTGGYLFGDIIIKHDEFEGIEIMSCCDGRIPVKFKKFPKLPSNW